MPSAYSTRNRLLKQATGENANIWGDNQNSGDFDLIDFALDGWATVVLSGTVTLSTANGTADQARARCVKFTGTGGTATIPSLEKSYFIWNATTGDAIITTGAGATATLIAGEIVPIICDASAVKRMTLLTMSSARLQDVADPTSNQDAATKKYVDDTAFSMAAGALPGQPGNAGKFLKTDGTVASWAAILTSDITSFSATATQLRVGTSTAAALTPGDVYNALAEVSLFLNGSNQVVTGSTSGTTLDMAAFINALASMTANSTLPNPTNPKVGQTGRIRIVQDGTGSRTLAYGSNWKFAGGVAPILTTTASAVDFLEYEVISATFIRAGLSRAWA